MYQLIFQTPICSNTSLLKTQLALPLSVHPSILHFPSCSTHVHHLHFLDYQIYPLPFCRPPRPAQIKLCCQLQKWNELPFIFLVLHKHKHVLICAAVLTDLPVRAGWYRLPPSAGLKAVREWGGFLCVGKDVIKLLLKLLRPCGVNT